MSRWRCVVIVLAILGLTLTVEAADEATYRIQFVVHFERNRLLTDVFCQEFRRELRDGVQAALGDLARVDVTDTHPQLREIRAKGLDEGLQNYRALSGQLEFFVFVSFNGSAYEIETRQYNGILRLPSRVVRKGQTRDRDFVLRTATLLLERDVGLMGTVLDEPDAKQQVQVELRGAKLGIDLSKWMKKDEVLELIKVDNGQGYRLPLSYLQVVSPPDASGVCTCKFHSPLIGGRAPRLSLARTSCVLLGTSQGPVRLRLRQEPIPGEKRPPSVPVNVEIRHNSFEGEEANMWTKNVKLPGDLDTTSKDPSKGRFNKLAFVTVRDRGRFPVAILDNNFEPVVLPGRKGNDLLLSRFRLLEQAVVDAQHVQNEMFKEIDKLTAKPDQRAEAMKRVKATLKRTEQDYKDLMNECQEMKKEADKLGGAAQPRLNVLMDRLRQLSTGERDLLAVLQKLDKIETEENDPRKKDWLVQKVQSKRLEADLEYGKAIEIFEKAPPEFLTETDKKHIEDLKKDWEPRDERHAKARQFIYEIWPNLDTQKLRDQIKEAKQAFEVCRDANDKIGLLKLKVGLDAHVQRVVREYGELKPTVNTEDEKPAKQLEELKPQLEPLHKDLQAYLSKLK